MSFSAVTVLNITIWWIIYPESVFLIIATLAGLIQLSLRLSRNDVIVLAPVSRDERGGLIAITRFCLHFVWVLFFPLLFIFSYIIMNGFRAELWWGLMFYTSLLFVAFFLPLVVIHKSMMKSRDRELLEIENLFKKYYAKYQEMLKSNYSDKQLNDISATLLRMKDMFDLTRSLPVWPYNLNLLTRFISIIVVPVLAFIIRMLPNIDNILSQLEKANFLLEIFKK